MQSTGGVAFKSPQRRCTPSSDILRTCPNFRPWSIRIWSQRTFIFVVDVTQSDNLMQDVEFVFGAALGFC